VQSAYQRGDLQQWITVRHAIEPRTDREPGKLDNKNMPWRSIYWESGNGGGKLLRESGFKSFPCVAPRWATQGGDIYGNSPGMEALGDIKQLQQEQFRKSQAIDYMVKPPLQMPSSFKNREIDTFPGGISYYDVGLPNGGISTAFDVNLNLRDLQLDLQDIRQRINAAFYADLFLMISQQPANGSMTATEVTERYEEKMLMLGPVVERLNNELLDPLVSTVFERLLMAGLLPPAPQELQGHELQIEYVSMLSQAQKAVAINGMDRLVHSIGVIAQLKPEALDKLNGDEMIDEYAEKLGVNPAGIVGGKQLALVREQKAKMVQQAQHNAVLQQGAEMAAKLGGVLRQGG